MDNSIGLAASIANLNNFVTNLYLLGFLIFIRVVYFKFNLTEISDYYPCSTMYYFGMKLNKVANWIKLIK